MSAAFYDPGPMDVFVGFINFAALSPADIDPFAAPPLSSEEEGATEWKYLGSCTVAPDVQAIRVHEPIQSDYNRPGIIQKSLGEEIHNVTLTLNFLNHQTYNRLKTDLKQGSVKPKSFSFTAGKLVFHYEDVALFLRYAKLPAALTGPQAIPIPQTIESAYKGRLYRRALLEGFRETTENARVLESTLILQCHGVPIGEGEMELYTEDEFSFPDVRTNE